MDSGIWKIAKARLCADCQQEMASEYVMRNDGHTKADYCDRCGQRKSYTNMFRYTMNKRGLERRNLLDI